MFIQHECMTDIEIARNTKLEKIDEVAKKIGIKEDDLEIQGKNIK